MALLERTKFYSQSKPFYMLLGITLVLVGFGLAMVASASAVGSFRTTESAADTFLRQASFAGLGIVGMLAAANMPLGFYRRMAGVFLLSTIGLQLFTVFFGTTIQGNRNWINIFGYSVQPSEFLKLALAISVALLMSKLTDDTNINRGIWLRIFAISGVAVGLVAVGGSDLGTGVVMAAMLMGAFLLGGMRWLSWLSLALGGVIVAAGLLLSSASRRIRFDAWLNPEAADPMGVRWQFEHGTMALASGGWLGTGVGSSRMKWGWIPEVHNDFIFAVIGEELGLLGASFVILAFFGLGLTMYVIAKSQTSVFARNIVTAIMLWITMQAFINIGVVLGLFPVLGVPLPFISAGGSALISNLAAVGVVLAIERHRVRNPLGGNN